MNLTSICSLILALTASVSLLAQEHPQEEVSPAGEHERFQPHRLSLFTGYGFIDGAIDEDGVKEFRVIPVLGLDYDYWFNYKTGLGLQNDLELSSYRVEKDPTEDINRHYAFVTALVFLYEPVPNWGLYIGPGYEFESEQGFPLLKIGTDVGLSFENGFSVSLTISYDIKEINSSASVGVTVGKKLGR